MGSIAPASRTDRRTVTTRPPSLDAGALAGALADDDRRVVFAALVLGAGSLDDVVRATGLARGAAANALARLVAIGLVIEGGGALVVLGAAFQQAARHALARPRSIEHEAEPPERRAVMDAFVAGGRLTKIPSAHAKRLVVLDWLAQNFEVGRSYTEPQVNEVLERRHADYVTLRRYLVDAGFLSREDGVYWRTGGTVPPGA